MADKNTDFPNSVLIIGDAGSLGLERIEQLLPFQRDETGVHVLQSRAHDLPEDIRMFCDSVMVGDEKDPKYIERALLLSKATCVILPMTEVQLDRCPVLGIQPPKGLAVVGPRVKQDPTRLALARALQKIGYQSAGNMQVLAASRTSTAVITYSYERRRGNAKENNPQSSQAVHKGVENESGD